MEFKRINFQEIVRNADSDDLRRFMKIAEKRIEREDWEAAKGEVKQLFKEFKSDISEGTESFRERNFVQKIGDIFALIFWVMVAIVAFFFFGMAVAAFM